MTIAEAPEARYVAGSAAPTPVQRVGRRDQVEAVGLLMGILGVLLVVVVTLGATPSLS
jgi:hypothetical protein